MQENHYDVLIIGGGISGAAAFHTLAKYTDIKSIALLEKYQGLATLNSNGRSNSQTIHCGDIETNYTLEKAEGVKKNSDMIIKYGLLHEAQNKFMFSHQKMTLAVGDEECDFMKKRFEEFKELYPYIQFFDKEKIKELEPMVVLARNKMGDRPENIVAMGVEANSVYTTVDFGKMAASLVEETTKLDKKTFIAFNEEVNHIQKVDDIFVIKTANYREYRAKAVLVDAGAHSLYLAHKMGIGLDKSCLPVAGSFYLTHEKILNGKVYMVQNPKLPFAALHGDPDLLAHMYTRFGPTALTLPLLERYHGFKSLPEFFASLNLDMKILKVFYTLFKDKEVRNYILYNYLYEVPFINRRLLAKDARKIVPSLEAKDISYAKHFGGVRPQVIDKTKGELLLGEARLDEVEGIIFNMTPSPGATSCLGNAFRDTQIIADYLGVHFDKEKAMELTTEML